MKTITSKLLKAFVVIVLFTGGSIGLSTTGVKTVNEAQASVTETQIIDYLEEYGYRVISAAPKGGCTSNWQASTILNGRQYKTTIYVYGNDIIGHTDQMYY